MERWRMVLCIALLVAVPLASSPAAATSPTRVTIPVGHAGDRIVYDESWHERIVGEEPRDDHGSRRSVIDVTTTQAPDRTHAMHAVARLNWSSAEPAGQDGSAFVHPDALSVGLATRKPIDCIMTYKEPLVRGPVQSGAIVAFAPVVSCSGTWRALALVSPQGRTLAVGDRLDPGWADDRRAEADDAEGHLGAVKNFDADEVVARGALVGGVPAVAVDSHVNFVSDRMVVEAPPKSVPDQPNPPQMPLAGFLLGWRFHEHHVQESANITTWWTAQRPYPVRVDARVDIIDTANDTGATRHIEITSILALAGVESGTTAIPWSATPAAPTYRDLDPDLERAPPDALAVQDGSGATLPFPLHVALDAFERGPQPSDFPAWRAQNPGSLLVGALWTRDNFGATAGPLSLPTTHAEVEGVWDLMFAAPQGTTAYHVEMKTLDGTQGIFFAPAHSVQPLPERERFTLSQIPRGPVTFAAALQRFSELPKDGRQVRIVTWGLPVFGSLQGTFDEEIRHLTIGSEEIRLDTGAIVEDAGTFLSMDAASGNITREDLAGTNDISGLSPTTSPVREAFADPPAVSAASVSPPPVEGWREALGLVALALLALAYFAPLVRFGITSLFTRLRAAAVLDHTARDAIAKLVVAQPGITPPELQASVGLGWTTTVYHLGVLERTGILRSIIDGRHKRFFAVGLVDARDIPKLAVLRNERTRQIHALLSTRPGITQREIALAIDIAPPSVAWHLRRLENAGLLARERRGREVALLPR